MVYLYLFSITHKIYAILKYVLSQYSAQTLGYSMYLLNGFFLLYNFDEIPIGFRPNYNKFCSARVFFFVLCEITVGVENSSKKVLIIILSYHCNVYLSHEQNFVTSICQISYLRSTKLFQFIIHMPVPFKL
jgi:hypothetical protein